MTLLEAKSCIQNQSRSSTRRPTCILECVIDVDEILESILWCSEVVRNCVCVRVCACVFCAVRLVNVLSGTLQLVVRSFYLLFLLSQVGLFTATISAADALPCCPAHTVLLYDCICAEILEPINDPGEARSSASTETLRIGLRRDRCRPVIAENQLITQSRSQSTVSLASRRYFSTSRDTSCHVT